jgi:hypothetical protein
MTGYSEVRSNAGVRMRNEVEHDAIEFVTDHFKRQGYSVSDVTRTRGQHHGYDLVVSRGATRQTIEVKGCTRPYGIPDPYYSEFDPESKRLVADLLCVVYFHADRTRELAVIPREAIPPDYVVPKLTYRISGKFKNERTIRRFIVNL